MKRPVKLRPLSSLQLRVLSAIGPEWTPADEVAKTCGWGGFGCRRRLFAMNHVLYALARRDEIEIDDADWDLKVRLSGKQVTR